MRACVWLEVRTTTSAAQLFRGNTQALRCIAALLQPILTPWFKSLFSDTLAVINISPEVENFLVIFFCAYVLIRSLLTALLCILSVVYASAVARKFLTQRP
jgi:hypothetical protein